MQATLRGTQIYFDVAGMQLAPVGTHFIERPVLFILHGGPGGDHLRFKQTSLELQQTAQLVFIDHRGCGRSQKTKKSDYTLENNIEDIEALRKYLGLNKISILGTSYGGVVGQGYAIRYGKYVDKLILVATAPSYHFIQEAKQYLQKQGSQQQIRAAEDLWAGTFKNASHAQRFFKIMDPLYSVRAQKYKKPALAKLKTIWSVDALNQGFGRFLRHYDFVPKLKKIHCPTLILAGDKDWICRPSQAKIIAKHIPNSKLKIFKNCGHSISTDAHKQYIKIINNFLERQ